MPGVTVPCAKCNVPVGIKDDVCPSCRAPVSRQLRAALEARLDASDEDYRDAKLTARRASAVPLVVGAVCLTIAGVLLYADLATDLGGQGLASTTVATCIGAAVLGLLLIACFVWTRRAPVAGLGAALAIWLVAIALAVGASPLQWLVHSFASLRGVLQLFATIVGLFILARGLAAALRVRRLRRAMKA